MKIIVGHSNMDLDCLGSIVLARYLFPDHEPVKSRFIHPVARKVQNLYEHHINFLHPKELRNQPVERIVIVDTRTPARVKEYLDLISGNSYEVEIFDHHPADDLGFANAVVHELPCGANTSQIGLELMQRGVAVAAEHATIALSGIYADTGNFTHENVTKTDFDVAAYLLGCGASLKLVKSFLKPLAARHQITLFHDVLNQLNETTIHGHQVITCYREIKEESEGLSAVVEKVFEIEGPDVLFAVFHFCSKNRTLIIGRNQKSTIDLSRILKYFGGGGHPTAASATVKNQDGREVYRHLLERLDEMLAPAVTASQIMSHPVEVIQETASLLQASLKLEAIEHSGLPVVDAQGKLVGMITLRDIMKGRRTDQMKAPLKSYMSRNPITAAPTHTVRQIEELVFGNNIGHLPVVCGDRLVGIITRTDLLSYSQTENRKRINFMKEIGLSGA
ncbi:MAG: CBS domain-containing protein [Spirochaetaceae bacterium]|nr:MAG: CBS domain-containing protein [Spirochaetaceae bacterium]